MKAIQSEGYRQEKRAGTSHQGGENESPIVYTALVCNAQEPHGPDPCPDMPPLELGYRLPSLRTIFFQKHLNPGVIVSRRIESGQDFLVATD